MLKHVLPPFTPRKPIKPLGTTVIEADDEVFFIAATKHIRAVMSELQKLSSYRKIMIAGGGNIGSGLARSLESSHSIKLIERNQKRAEHLAESLDSAVIFCGDAADYELLAEEQMNQQNVFLAVTNDDEANIMSNACKADGCTKNDGINSAFGLRGSCQGAEIDIAISPQQATISALLTHVRRGDIVNVYSLRKGAAEAIEAIAHGDENTSKVVNRMIRDIKLPPGTTIGAIVRGEEVLIAHDNTVIQSDDHVILFLIDKKYISQVERLFQVSAIFI